MFNGDNLPSKFNLTKIYLREKDEAERRKIGVGVLAQYPVSASCPLFLPRPYVRAL